MAAWNFVHKEFRVILSKWNATPKPRYELKVFAKLEPRGQNHSIFILVLFKDLRRRFRYLRHLPLTCEFAICELDLKPPVLSWETLNHFKGEKDNRSDLPICLFELGSSFLIVGQFFPTLGYWPIICDPRYLGFKRNFYHLLFSFLLFEPGSPIFKR